MCANAKKRLEDDRCFSAYISQLIVIRTSKAMAAPMLEQEDLNETPLQSMKFC